MKGISMSRKVFVSYSHRLDQEASEDFRKLFSDERDVFIDKSIRHDIGEYETETIKKHLRKLIADSSVTVVLIGAETGGRKWIDWEIQNSLRKNDGNHRNGLLGVRIKHKEHWVPERFEDNIPEMGLIIDWPRDKRTLANAIEDAYKKRNGTPDLSRPLRTRDSKKK